MPKASDWTREIMADHVSLKEAAEIFRTSYDTLNRRISDGLMPEAVKVGSGRGKWLIRSDDLRAIADRENWALDLRQEPATLDAQASPEALPYALAEAVREALGLDSTFKTERDRTEQLREYAHQLALEKATLVAETSAAATMAESTIRGLEAAREATRRRLDQMVSDLEQERSERSRGVADLAAVKASLTRTEAILETERTAADRERARLVTAEQRLIDQTEDLAAAHQAMGWWGRRRYKNLRT